MTSLRREDGVTMVVMVAVLTIVLILSAAAISVALTTKTSTQEGRGVTRAQAAAEAGLRAALFRLNQAPAPVADAACPGPGSATPATGWSSSGDAVRACAPITNAPALGDGTSYTYLTSTAVRVGAAGPTAALRCSGTDPVVAAVRTSLSLAERCITSTGSAQGATRRVQIRVVSDTSVAQFPLPGMLGMDHVCFGCNISGGNVGTAQCLNKAQTSSGGNGVVDGVVGSNKAVTVNTVTWTPLGANAVYVPATDSCPLLFPATQPAAIVRTLRPWTPADLGAAGTIFYDPSADATNPMTARRQACQGTSTDAAICNDNAGIVAAGCATMSADRVLTLRNNCAATLPTGTYDLCGISMGQGSSIEPQTATSAVRILFDSAARMTKGTSTPACAATNNFAFPNNASFLSTAANVKQAQLFVYGNPANPSSHIFSFGNAASFHFLLKAPNSVVQIQNASGSNAPTMYGGLAAWAIEMQNNLTFRWDPSVDAITTGATPVYFQSSWMQCSAPTVPASATSGC